MLRFTHYAITEKKGTICPCAATIGFLILRFILFSWWLTHAVAIFHLTQNPEPSHPMSVKYLPFLAFPMSAWKKICEEETGKVIAHMYVLVHVYGAAHMCNRCVISVSRPHHCCQHVRSSACVTEHCFTEVIQLEPADVSVLKPAIFILA